MKKIYFFVLFSLLFSFSNAQFSELERKLFDLEGVEFESIKTPEGFESAYKLMVKQPLDHKDPSKGSFYQRVFLTHSGFDRPTVICTEGYDRSRNRLYEPTRILSGNQLDVEHRFFGKSMPDSLDYSYLNLEQAAADLHRINKLFRTIYNGKWVSTGISKGGSTTIFYRYFYPEDVDVSIPYVAPLNRAFEDPRLYEFQKNIGSKECREDIRNFQIKMLKNRDFLLPRLKWFAKGEGSTYDYVGFESAFEYAVLEFPFSFWQYGSDCSKIPTADSDLEECLQYLIDISGMTFFSDKMIKNYGSHYYQSAQEMGYYGYETSPFKDYLKALPVTSNPHATFLPGKIKVEFDPNLLKNTNEWISTNGNEFIYINGALDTWSATAVPKQKGVDAVWYFLEGKHHGSARIKNMNDQEYKQLTNKLEEWLSIDIEKDIRTKE